MESITITKRSTNDEIENAIRELKTELNTRTAPVDIDINQIDVILKKFIADFWTKSNIGIPDTKTWLKMNFNVKY